MLEAHHIAGFIVPPILWVFFVSLISLWVILWKGYAVWTSAKRGEKKWFIVLLLLNTLSILEIFYIFKIAKKSKKEVWATMKKVFSFDFFKKNN